jgi:DNA processing protein
LAEQGALISEWPLGTPPRPHHFPQRNRLIAGLVRGVLVVEAAARSGSLITARLANEMGRNVYAIPGSIHSALTKGCHALIKEGAKLVESVEDVLEDLAWPIHQSQPAALLTPPPAALEFTGDAKAVLEALGADPAVPDILAARTGLNAARLQAALLALELAERITLLPCGRVAPQNQASSK